MTKKRITLELTPEEFEAFDNVVKHYNLGSIIEEQKPQWPSDGDEYYSVGRHGDIYLDVWGDDEFDAALKAQGRIFRTKQEAEDFSERERIMQELRECDGVVEYEHGTPQYTIERYLGDFGVVCMEATCYPNLVWFKTREYARNAIYKLGDTKLRKLFRVEGE